MLKNGYEWDLDICEVFWSDGVPTTSLCVCPFPGAMKTNLEPLVDPNMQVFG